MNLPIQIQLCPIKFLWLLPAIFFFTGCTGSTGSGVPDTIPVIDTHIHLYDPYRDGGVEWPSKRDTVLYRPVLPGHFDSICKLHHIDAVIVVEASSLPEDNQWILDLVEYNQHRYIGFVGNLPAGSDEFKGLLDRFAADSRFVGIRIKGKPGGESCFTDAFWRDLEMLQSRGMVLDILMAGLTLSDVAEIARRNPELRIVINHLTGVRITGEPPDPKWVNSVRAVAEYPNVYCKISSIFQRSGRSPAPKEVSYYAPVFDAIFDAFGEDRVFYGSDWPVIERSGSYEEQLEIIYSHFAPRGRAVLEKLFWKNAAEFYGVRLQYSEAFERYRKSKLEFEAVNPFFPRFALSEVTGLGYFRDPELDPVIQAKLDMYRASDGPFFIRLNKKEPELGAAYQMRNCITGFADSITFRDPTSPIKVGDTYHIWYSRTWGTPPVGQERGSQDSYHDLRGRWKRIYSWDYVSIWHATSKDGYRWEEQGMALEPGPTGSYDDRCVFTPDILVDNGKYYLYYQVATSPHVYRDGPHHIAMAWADKPEGPWHKSEEPVLYSTGVSGDFDGRKVHDPCLIKKDAKYWLYYKGDGDHSNRVQFREPFYIGWGVAIADRPEGPFVRSELNPVVCGGHEVMIFPYKSGVGAMVRQGPELNTLQYAKDGLNFEVKSHLMHVPHAGSFFRKGRFKDIDECPADLPAWGMAHDYRFGSQEAHIIRFDLSWAMKPE